MQIVGIAISAALLLLVLELVRRHRLTEEHSLFWILSALALLVISLFREVLDVAARWLGVFYPPMVLLLLLVFFVFLGLLYFSVVISRLRRQVERLVEDVAILDATSRRRQAIEDAARPTPEKEGDDNHDPRSS